MGLSAPLIACAGLKITYDVALYFGFRGRPAPEEVRPSGLTAELATAAAPDAQPRTISRGGMSSAGSKPKTWA